MCVDWCARRGVCVSLRAYVCRCFRRCVHVWRRRFLGDLVRPRKADPCRGAAVIAHRVAPPRDFLRKFLPSRDLKSLLNIRDVQGGFTTRRAALGAADPERAARNTAAPSQGCSVCRLCQATVVGMCYTMVSEVVRELLGFPLGCRRFFVGFVGGT